jgi:glycosyltransferase involved in cell wall biosynthesis
MVSIVIPIFNEEEILNEVLKSLLRDLSRFKLKYEVLLVENGSKDRSVELVNFFARKNNKIRAIHLPYANYGKAIFEGYEKSRGDYIANFSVDWVDLVFLTNALKYLSKGYDLVLATKYEKGSRDRRSLIRRVGGMLFHALIHILFRVTLSDTHGIKVIKRKSVIPVAKKCVLREESFDTELNIRSFREGLKIREVPVFVKEKRPTRVNIIKRAVSSFSQLILLWFILFKEGNTVAYAKK